MKYKNYAITMYDGGWRSDDRDRLIRKYDLTETEADQICAELEKIQKENEDCDTIEIYANYGVLAHEKLPVYSIAQGGVISDKIKVKIPEGVKISNNRFGDILVEFPDSEHAYLLCRLLNNTATGKPCFEYINKNGHDRRIMLEIVD